MALMRTQPAAALVHFLLLSVLAQPSLARRSNPVGAEASKAAAAEEQPQSEPRAEFAKEADPSELGSLSELVSAQVARGTKGAATAQALLEAIRSDEQEDASWCGLGYSTTMRWYHFEMDIVGEEKDHVRHFALELVRSPLAPRLLMHAGMTWGVRRTGDSDYPLDWVLTPLDGAPSGYTIGIDFLYEVETIRSLKHDDAPNSLEVIFVNGSSITLTGGLYYPEKVVLAALDDLAYQKDEPEQPEEGAQAEKANAIASVSSDRSGDLVPIARYSKHMQSKGHLGGVAVGFGLTFTFSSAMMLMNSALASFATALGLSLTIPLTVAQIFSFTTAGGLGLAGGVAFGLGVGLVGGIPIAIASSVASWVKTNRELSLSASEKVFAKLDCHRHFVRCGWDGDFLVPETKTCPSK